LASTADAEGLVMTAKQPFDDLFGAHDKVPAVPEAPAPKRRPPLWLRTWFRVLVLAVLVSLALGVAASSYIAGGRVGYVLGHEAPTDESARLVIEDVAAKAVAGDLQPYLERIPTRYQSRLGAESAGGVEGAIRAEAAELRQPVKVSRLEWLNDRRLRVWLAGDSDGTVWAFTGGKWMVSDDDVSFTRPEEDPAG
jgi:hypothetical protein